MTKASKESSAPARMSAAKTKLTSCPAVARIAAWLYGPPAPPYIATRAMAVAPFSHLARLGGSDRRSLLVVENRLERGRGIGRRNGTQQCLRVRVPRAAEHLLGRAHLQ